MAEGPLDWFELPVSARKLVKCHVCAAVDKSYTIVQQLVHLPGKQKVPGLNPGGAA